MSKSFNFGTSKNLLRWFPGHMSKGLTRMKENLRKVDCVIEVHDARIPFSGRNPMLKEYFTAKPHVVLLNKVDLIKVSSQQVQNIFNHYQKEGVQKLLFTQASTSKYFSKVHDSVKQIIPACLEVVQKSDRFNREAENDIELMIVGVPNVGKSSLINDIRRYYLKRKNQVAKVGKNPGETRSVSFKIQVCDNPCVFLLDTPGIFKAKIEDMEEGMRLAVCNTVHDHVMGAPMVAEYLLYLLNDNFEYEYVKYFGLREPTNDIRTMLKHIATEAGRTQPTRVYRGTGPDIMYLPDYNYAAAHFLNVYREGKIGKFLLDRVC